MNYYFITGLILLAIGFTSLGIGVHKSPMTSHLTKWDTIIFYGVFMMFAGVISGAIGIVQHFWKWL